MFKKQWREFQRGRPGHRFQERFERNQEARSRRSSFTRFLKPAAAIVLLAVGVVLCFIPGPGIPFLLIGAGMLADVSRPIARAMDRVEVSIRALVTHGRRWWDHASRTAKNAAIALAVFVASGATYGGVKILLERMD
jgi:hypothetical protein